LRREAADPLPRQREGEAGEILIAPRDLDRYLVEHLERHTGREADPVADPPN
jgi:hypothetical protein